MTQNMMDLFDDLSTRYQRIKLTKQVSDRESGGAVAPVNQDLLHQYGLIDKARELLFQQWRND
eukprot:2909241-Ditylum_brightwellii.AAC.1